MIALVLYSLRRVVRHRAVLAAILTLPLVCGLGRAALPGSAYTLAAAWACPFVTAVVAGAAVWFQGSVDDAIGLTDALKNTLAGRNSLAASRFVAAVLLLLPSIAVLVCILLAA